MILIDSVAEAPKGVINIDLYHRGHLSMRKGTEMTVCLLPTPERPNGLRGLEEIVISPIAFESWEFLVRVTAVFLDRPGVLRKLANAMQAMRLNVVYEESATIDNSRFHRVEVLAHTGDLVEQMNKEAEDGRLLMSDLSILPVIERRLKALCLNELVTEEGRPRLKVRPMEGLRNAHRLAARAPGSRYRVTMGEKGELILPAELVAMLDRRSTRKSTRSILVSDTRDRLLRALIPRDDTGFTFVRIRHRDFVGSLFRISDVIASCFTAVATLTRLKKQNAKNDIELLLHSKTYPHPRQDTERRLMVSQVLSADSLQDLEIEIAYPRKPGAHVPDGDWKRPAFEGVQIINQESPVDGEDELMLAQTSVILEKRIQSFDSGPMPTRLRHSELRKVALELAAAEGVLPSRPQVFLSYRFRKNQQIIDVKQQLMADPSFAFVDGRNAAGPLPIRTLIRDRIRESQGFIGIWPSAGPLDWLLWELGVAHAFGIPVLLLPHEKLDLKPHQRLMPEYEFMTHNDRNILAVLGESWAWFRGKVLEQHRHELARRIRGYE